MKNNEQIKKKVKMYVTVFDYFDKAFIVLYSAGWGVSINLFVNLLGLKLMKKTMINYAKLC